MKKLSEGRNVVEQSLDIERREMMRINEKRLQSYMESAERWLGVWAAVHAETKGLSLLDAHKIIIEKASSVLPFNPNADKFVFSFVQPVFWKG